MGWIAKYSSGGTVPAFVLAPTISTSSLPSGEVGLAYNFALAAFGGIPPYTWTASGLPAGLNCSSGGVISGSPTAFGSFTVNINLTDSNSTPAPPVNLPLSIATQPSITTTSLPAGTVGTPYSFQLQATGGVPPYTWTETGTLQAGLSMSPNGLISGTPTAGGTVTPSFTATDSLSVPSAPTGLSLTVNANALWFGAVLPTLPTQFSTTSSPPIPANTNRGSYYTPGVGGDAGLTLQAALNAAAAATGGAGDVIQLLSGTTYTTASVFTLPARAGSGWIYVITNTAPEINGIGLPGAGTRVSPANIPAMASLRTTLANTGGPVVNRANGASQYRLVGLDLELTDATAQSGNVQFYVVNFNNGDTSVSTLASAITLDRCYISGAPTTGVRHAVGLDGVNMEVTECYIEHCYQFGNADTNAIVAINSTGPYKVTNNYLNAQGEITLFGGSDTTLPSPNMPSDITCQRNYYFKQTFTGTGTVTSGSTTLTIATTTSGILLPGMYVLAASGFIPNFNQIVKQLTGPTGGAGTYQMTNPATGTSSGAEAMTGNPYGKNSQEFKVGQRVLFDSNYVDHAFATVQPRTAFVLTGRNQSGANPWYGLFNFTITNNVFTDCQQGGINVLLQDNNSTASDRILFRNNLFILSKNDNTSSTCSGFVSSNSPTTGGAGAGSNIIFDHNTFIATAGQSSSMIFCGAGAPTSMSLTNMVWSNNIFDNSNIGLSDAGGGIGYANVVPRQSTPVTWIGNVHIGTPDSTLPAGNFKAASQAATGFTSYGSNTIAAGYALTASSPYHAVGVSGLNQPANSAGTPDGTDAGCNIETLPTKAFQPPSLLTIAQAGYIIVAPAATLTAAGIGVGPLSNPTNTQTNAYNVDPTGVADSTAGIQHAINDGCLNYQPIYLPNQSSGAQGIYKITNTLEFYTFANQFDTAYSQTSGHHFLGATNLQGQNPILRASNANGNFTNLLGSGLARPVAMVTAFSAGTTLPPVSPTNFNMGFDPYTFPSGWGNGTADVVSHSFINVNIDTGGLANAGGTSIVGAQTVWVANLQITATGSVYGIGVLPGNGSVLMNVKITGGQYGINSFMTYALSHWQSDDPTICGLTCIGQTNACITAGGTASPILVVGGDLEPSSGGVAYDPVATSDTFDVNHSAMFYNVKVVGPGDASSTAFKNVGGYTLYLGDVWVSGFTNVTQFAGLGAQLCGGAWTHVTEYVATNQYKGNTIHTGTANPPWPSFNWVNGVITTGNAGDGTLNNQPATSITTNAPTPPTNLVSRHVVTLPLIDTVPFVDIRNYGAAALSLTGQAEGGPTHNRGTFTFNFSNDSASTPDNVTPITNAITAAAAANVPTAVLIPIGVWETSGQIHVPANVQIMGVGADNRSWISTHKNWVPTAAGGANGTPVITTDSNANATTALVNFGINMRRNAGTGTYTANGGTGQNNDYFIPYIWQCGGQCFIFGNQHHYQFITTPVATFALQYRQFQGANAGGRFYGGDTPDAEIGLGGNTAARALFVNGSQQPMYFYSLNLENSKNTGANMAYNMELTGASNVRVYGTKREGNATNTYSITQNCNNVGLFGSSFIRIGNPANATFIGATGNSNILVHAHTAFSDTTSTTQYILSDAGSGFNLDSPKILSVYKNGTLNDAAMVIGGGAQNPIGLIINAAGTGSFSTEGFPIFQDRFREGRWAAPVPPVNAQGWPTTDFSFILYEGHNNQAWMTQGGNGAFSCGFTTSAPFTGTITGTGCTIPPASIVKNGNNTTFDLVVANGNTGLFQFNITGTPGNSGATAIFAYLPAYRRSSYSAVSLITNEAIAHYKQVNRIRAMEAVNAWKNGGGDFLPFTTLLAAGTTGTTGGTLVSQTGATIFWPNGTYVAVFGLQGSSSAFTEARLVTITNNAVTWTGAALTNPSTGLWMPNTSATRSTPANTKTNHANPPHGYAAFPGNWQLDGNPVEWFADIANACGIDLWTCVPVNSDTTWESSLATYLAANFNGKIYIELGNELWNDGSNPRFGAVSTAVALANYNGFPCTDSTSGPFWQYVVTRYHQVVQAFRAAYGANYASKVRITFANQTGQGGYGFVRAGLEYYKITFGSPSADLSYTAIAPYFNLPAAFITANPTPTAQQIETQMTITGGAQPMNSKSENHSIMAQHYGLQLVSYEGQWQVNAEPSGLGSGVSGALTDATGWPPVLENFYNACFNSGFVSCTHSSGGVSTLTAFPAYAPANELSTSWSSLTTTGSPIFAAIQSFNAGFTYTRNVVSGSGSVIQGGNWADQLNAAAPTLNPGGGFAPYSNQGGYVPWLVNCTKPGTYSLTVNVTGSGTTNLEVNGVILTSGFSLVTGNNNLGNVTLRQGPNYILLGNGVAQGACTINSLTFT